MACKFIKYDDLLVICDECGYITPLINGEIPIRVTCKPIYQPQYEPSLIIKIKNFAKAAASHLEKGNPTVTEEQLSRRLEICKTCVLFKPTADGLGGTCLHNSCGCSIKDTLEYMNKIAWADQECPVGKWGKEST